MSSTSVPNDPMLLDGSSNSADVPSAPRGRFEPGRSGNPKGRPRKKVIAQSAIDHALGEQLTIKDAKGTRKISAAEVIAKRLVQKAAAGDVSAIKLILMESPKFLSKVLDAESSRNGYDGFFGYLAETVSLDTLREFRHALASWQQLPLEERLRRAAPSVSGSR